MNNQNIVYRNIGKNVERSDARAIVTGRAEFFDDFKLQDTLIGYRVGSPYPHARITHIDTSKAEAYPGVHAVITHKNIPEEIAHWRMGMPPLSPMLEEKVYYVGQAVAIIAADTKQIAQEAAELIDVEYEVLEPVFWAHEAVKEDAPQLYPYYPGNTVPELHISGEQMMTTLRRGDVDKALEECDIIEEGTYTYDKFGSPMAIEPPGITVHFKPDGRLKVYGTIQAPHTMQQFVTISTGMKNHVDIKSFNVGGSFGNKSAMGTTTAYCTALSAATHRPVKMYLTKAEQLLVHDMRIGIWANMKVGLKDGKLHAVKGVVNLDTGAINGVGQIQLGVGEGEMQVAFGKCRNWEVIGNVVMTNHVQTASVRGFGGQEIKCTFMPLVMKAVQRAGIDPLDFYIDNFASVGDQWIWRDSIWYTTFEQDYRKVMRDAAEQFGWKDKWKGWNIPTYEDEHKAIGVGVSVHGNADVGEDQAEAYVRIESSGDVFLHNSVTEIGNGEHSSLRKFVADVLDIDASKVIVLGTDTQIAPYDFGQAGSCGTLTTGEACARAAIDARKQLLEAASRNVFHCPPEMLTTKDGLVFMKDNPDSPRVPYAACFDKFGLTITGHGEWRSDYSKSNFNVYFSEVEVDKDTGVVKLNKVLVGTDVGQIIDPSTLEMQAQGGFGAAAADTGLFDESVLDEYTGHIMTSNLCDYKWRTFDDFPHFTFVCEEDHPDISHFKGVGFGEISGAPGPASMMMAISNAIGKDFCVYPASPKAILEALGKA